MVCQGQWNWGSSYPSSLGISPSLQGIFIFLLNWQKPSKTSLNPHRTKISIPFHNREDGMRSKRTSLSQDTGRTRAGTARSLSAHGHPSQSSSLLFPVPFCSRAALRTITASPPRWLGSLPLTLLGGRTRVASHAAGLWELLSCSQSLSSF